MPARRYISPKSFSSLPPATPVSEAEVYLGAAFATGEEAEVVDVADAAEVERVKGEVRAVDRLNGFDDAGCIGCGAGEIELVWIGGKEAGWIDVGLPPGVRARVREMPMPPSPSMDWDGGRDVDVEVLARP